MSRRTLAGALAGLTVFGAVFAMAANLGGVTSGQLGADSATVAACDSDGVSTAYASTWDATDERYELTSVTVSGIADTCDSRTLSVSVTDSTGAQIGAGSITIPTAAATAVTVSLSTAASAALAEGVHVVIA